MEEINHNQRAHALLSASGSSRWLKCPASAKLEDKVTSDPKYIAPESPWAEEGTLAHELAESILQSYIENKDNENISHKIGTLDHKDEMLSEVIKYTDHIIPIMQSATGYWIERKVEFTNIVPDGFGTCDFGYIDLVNKVIGIVDLKYGKFVKVSAYKNSQLILYVLGLLEYIKLKYLDIDLSEFKFIVEIVQPRMNNFSSYEMTYEQLMTFAEEFKEKAELAMSDDPPFNVGEDQCKYCKAKDVCPALFDKVTEMFEVINDKKEITLEDKKELLDNKKLITDYLDGLEKQVTEHIVNGGEFEGYTVIEGMTKSIYTDSAEEVLKEELGDDAFETKLKNITTIEKMIGKKRFKMLEVTMKPQGKPKLVKNDDKILTKNVFMED